MTTRDLKNHIDLCPLWNFKSSDEQDCLASGEHCEIDIAEASGSCPIFKKLFEIFEDVLRSRNEIETGADAHEIKT